MGSKHVPFIPGESAADRHARRLEENLRRQNVVKKWAHDNAIALTIHNHGHHWRFTRGKIEAEWWPSSAKLVLQRNYNNEHHVHDHEQAIEVLRNHFGEKPPEDQPKVFWLAQYDGTLEPGTFYPCSDCKFPGLTRDTGVWKWGRVRGESMTGQWGYVLVCRDPRDCWRRAEFMGAANWKKKAGS